MSADVPIASKLYVAIAESGCALIVRTAMIYAGAMAIVQVAAPKSIAVPMDGRVVSVTSGCVLGAVDATTRALNVALERKKIYKLIFIKKYIINNIIYLYMKSYHFNNGEIVYSIVIPIYNQELIIINNLQSIITNTHGNFELILILDFCFDNTELQITNYFDNYINNNPHFIQLKIFKNTDKPLFETKCDNIGFKNASGKYCLEIQADMEMTENGYNIHLTKPFLLLNNVIAVSGRCAHNLFDHGTGIGKLGTSIETNICDLGVNKNNFYVYETCNRGPLLLDLQKLREMNYLDEDNYFLDDSDHDLMARSFIQKQYICGYVPIDFNAPLQNGSTRNNKYIDCQEFWINKIEKNRLTQLCHNSGLNIKYKKIWITKEPKIYDISHL